MALFLAFEFQKFRSSLIDLGAQVVNRHSGPRSVRERGWCAWSQGGPVALIYPQPGSPGRAGLWDLGVDESEGECEGLRAEGHTDSGDLERHRSSRGPRGCREVRCGQGIRPSSACLPKPLAFPYHFSASCYLSDILAKLNWALCPRLSWVRLYLDWSRSFLSCFLSKPYPLFQAQLMKPFQVFPKPAVSSFPTLAMALEYFCRQPLGVWYSFESQRHPR